MNQIQDNNLILNLSDDESEPDSDSDSDFDSNSDSDDLDEDIQELLNNFNVIFRVFENDHEVKYLNYNEKLLLINIFNNIPYIDYNNYDEFKENLLLFRAKNHPLINYYLIRKLTSKEKIDCSDIKTTLKNYICNECIYDEELISPDTNHVLDTVPNKEYIKEYVSIVKSEIKPSVGLVSLPDEILERILLFCIPTVDLDIHNFFRIRTTCKTFYRIMFSKYFTNSVIKSFKLQECVDNKFSNLNQLSLPIYKNVVYEFIFNIFKNYLIKMLGSHIIKVIGGFTNFFKLPFIDGINDACIDNLCGSDCAYHYHYLHHIINSPISRGIDSKGRLFILFIYKTQSNDIYYEFIYNNEHPNLLNVTFSGVHQNTFIGNKSMNYNDYNSASYRELKYRSYEYIERLIKGEAGEVRFNDNITKAEEDTTKPVRLFYEKNEFKSYINQTYINSLGRILD
jgi:hypothetical protein